MATTEADDLLAKIHTSGYWRVSIRPTEFDPQRISSLSECEDILRHSQVTLRGWYYPHIPPDQVDFGQDWIESKTDWLYFIEYWRFFQSAQFVHHFACTEDQEQEFRGGAYLSALSALYTFTEIFVFAGRLAERGLLRPAAEISVELNGMNNRTLYMPPERVWFHRYQAHINKITFGKTISEQELLTNQDDIALEGAIHVFERFHWKEPSRQLLAEDQRKLLERRL